MTDEQPQQPDQTGQPAQDPKAESILELEKVEYYASQVNAWFATRMERDKSLLLLSGGAIGLLITLATTGGKKTSCEGLLFFVAILSFTVCLLVVVHIFSANAEHLEKEINEKTGLDAQLGVFDDIAIFSFGFGVIISVLIATLVLFHKQDNAVVGQNGCNMVAPKEAYHSCFDNHLEEMKCPSKRSK